MIQSGQMQAERPIRISCDSYELGQRRWSLEHRYGFPSGTIAEIEGKCPNLFSQADLNQQETCLQQIGISNPGEIIESYPNILIKYRDPNSIQHFTGELKQIGIAKPSKTITENPRILRFTLSEIGTIITEIRTSGKINDPLEMINNDGKSIETQPTVLSKYVQLLQGVFNFPHPSKIIQKCPWVIHLSPSQIGKLISELQNVGIYDPIRLLDDHPLFFSKSSRFITQCPEQYQEYFCPPGGQPKKLSFLEKRTFLSWRRTDEVLDLTIKGSKLREDTNKINRMKIIDGITIMYSGNQKDKEELASLDTDSLLAAIAIRQGSIHDLIARAQRIETNPDISPENRALAAAAYLDSQKPMEQIISAYKSLKS